MIRVALLDGDVFIYAAAAAAEVATDWGDGMWTLHAQEGEAEAILLDRIKEVTEAVEADRITIALSDKHNFRKDVLPTYKANRANVRRPMLIPHLQEFLRKNFDVREMQGLEGDDVLGILATTPKAKYETVIVSIDKDFGSIPGKTYYINRPEQGIVETNEHQANLFHMTQTLTGDPTDGYAGCPGVGPVGAKKLLDAAVGEGTPWADTNELIALCWKAVVGAYEKKGLTEEDALTQARVARILRHEDYDHDNQEPILWTPPN